VSDDASEVWSRSLRDPAASLVEIDDRLLRFVRPEAASALTDFLASRTACDAVAAGHLVGSRVLDATEAHAVMARLGSVAAEGGVVLEHDRVPFVSYPHEWPPELLYEAARLTLDLAEAALLEGYGLKDATPYNVLFRGAEPVFVDVASFEPRDPRDGTWLPYAQFVRTFLLPLAAYRLLGLEPRDVFLVRREGLSPEEFTRMVPLRRRLLPPLLELATLPARLGRTRRAESIAYTPRLERDADRAGFMLRATFRRLRRALVALRPPTSPASTWSDYYEPGGGYTPVQAAAKEAFVRTALTQHGARAVLDVGCNAGRYSTVAASTGARVIAIDNDPGVLGPVAARARAEHLDVLPLRVDIARPTPAVGWRNRESEGFLARARGAFDGVLLLAVVHHLVVSEGIPLVEVLDLAAMLTSGVIILEYVTPTDPMFRRIARGRDALHAHLTREYFESVAVERFTIERVEQLPGMDRWLYVLRPRHEA